MFFIPIFVDGKLNKTKLWFCDSEFVRWLDGLHNKLSFWSSRFFEFSLLSGVNYFNIISDDEISVSHSRECHSPGYVWSKVQPKLTLRDKHANKAYALSFLNILALTLCNPVYLYTSTFLSDGLCRPWGICCGNHLLCRCSSFWHRQAA